MENVKHKILALKYRPKNFKELIGQNIMVETIINSIKLNKLPNAYLLTGIRGTGKTTTARLIAKAINCKKNFIAEKVGEYCDCDSCKEIGQDNHLDVLEMDAASRTGIDDVRELIESSKYNPTSAKYKIIILDEVHMLSKQAFNGLLKTLEEPPPHLKFIFATTEVKKIPITIISRCQRFDLHRVSIENLVKNLQKILQSEKGNISEDALTLIAKSAEGSVRDSLSLLDKILISQSIEGKEINESFVRKILGIADKSKTLDLLNLIFKGDLKKSIDNLRNMVNEGIDPKNFLNDLLELIHLIQQNKTLGNIESEILISESEKKTIELISNNINMTTLILFWQFILKNIEELSIVANPFLALEMLIVRLIHLKDMPTYEKVLEKLNDNNLKTTNNDENVFNKTTNNKKEFSINDNQQNESSKEQIKNTIQTKPVSSLDNQNNTNNTSLEKILSFEDLVYLSSKKREMKLKYDLERNVSLIKFSNGKIDISFNQNLDKDFVRNLSQKLLEWTGSRWVITLSKDKGQKTFLELKDIKKKETLKEEKEGDIYKKFKDAFSDAELLDVKKND
jgi:DNA polymerase III subunit gamma/tau